MRPAAFLDRDGVLNRLVWRDGLLASPQKLEQFDVFPGVGDLVERLRSCDLLVVVVTNQPDIARGKMAPEELEAMHARLRSAVRLDALYACCHDDADQCACRKPKPGLLIQASLDLGIDLERSYMIGDSWKDVGAGRNSGCKTFLLRREDALDETSADVVVATLEAAVDRIEHECRARGNDSESLLKGECRP